MSDKPPPYPEQQPPPGAYPQPGFAPQQPGYPQPPGYPQQPGYPVQPAPYPAANQPGFSSSNTTTIITQQPQVTHIVATGYHEAPVATTCPRCHASVVTATSYVSGTLTWLACLGLCVIGCDAGCCLIPFCLDSMKDVIHVCPACGTQVGVYRRMWTRSIFDLSTSGTSK